MTTKQRIEVAADLYSNSLEKELTSDKTYHPASYYAGVHYGYREGAKFGIALERERSKKLVDALKTIRQWYSRPSEIELIDDVLADYESEEG